jgi:transcriptional regulator with XRE-family HTH domain
MRKYTELLTRARESVEYWTQSAMRSFVSDVLRRMEGRKTSRADLAEKMGVSPAYVSKILRGDVNFTLESMVKVASALGGRLSVSIVDASTVANSNWCRIEAKREFTSGTFVVGTALRADNSDWRETLVGPPQVSVLEKAA